MIYKNLKLYSNIGNRLKKLDKKNIITKFIEDKSYSYFDKDGFTIKLKYEVEKEKRIFQEFIKNMTNYQKIEEDKRKNYLSRLRGYKDIDEERKFAEKRKINSQNIIQLKKRKDLLFSNKLYTSYKDLQTNIHNYLIAERNIRKQKFNEIKQENLSDLNNKIKKINYGDLMSLNSSLNSETYNKARKLKCLETSTSNLMPNIIRRRIHINKSNNIILNHKKQMNLFRLKLNINKNNNLIDIKPFSGNETNNTNINSNESNSFNFNMYLPRTINKKRINSYHKKILNIKNSTNNYQSLNQNKSENKMKLKESPSLDKSKEKEKEFENDKSENFINNNINKNDDAKPKLNKDSGRNSFTNTFYKNSGNDRKIIKLKKINILKSGKLTNNLTNNSSNSSRRFNITSKENQKNKN